jgi:hypothetical protein
MFEDNDGDWSMLGDKSLEEISNMLISFDGSLVALGLVDTGADGWMDSRFHNSYRLAKYLRRDPDDNEAG